MKKQKQSKSGVKHDEGKARMSLLSSVALFKVAQVMSDGESKYGSHNWREGFKWTRVLDAASRHLVAYTNGMDKDPDSGRSNLAHVAACIFMLLEFEETLRKSDDRYKLPSKVLKKMYPGKRRKNEY